MHDTSHLVALVSRLGRERARLAAATRPAEIAIRTEWVRQIEREVAREEAFIGARADEIAVPKELRDMTDDELRAALSAP